MATRLMFRSFKHKKSKVSKTKYRQEIGKMLFGRRCLVNSSMHTRTLSFSYMSYEISGCLFRVLLLRRRIACEVILSYSFSVVLNPSYDLPATDLRWRAVTWPFPDGWLCDCNYKTLKRYLHIFNVQSSLGILSAIMHLIDTNEK